MKYGKLPILKAKRKKSKNSGLHAERKTPYSAFVFFFALHYQISGIEYAIKTDLCHRRYPGLQRTHACAARSHSRRIRECATHLCRRSGQPRTAILGDSAAYPATWRAGDRAARQSRFASAGGGAWHSPSAYIRYARRNPARAGPRRAVGLAAPAAAGAHRNRAVAGAGGRAAAMDRRANRAAGR